MKFEVGIHHYHPRLLGSHEYYCNTFEARDEKEASVIAIKSFKDCQPFSIKGEVVEVTRVTLLTEKDLRWVSE